MAYAYIDRQWTKRSSDFQAWLRRQSVSWRREPVVNRLARPTRLGRARRLGYKAKIGIVVVRVRVRHGGARKPRPVSGRRQKAMGVAAYTRSISLQGIAQQRAGRKYPNLRVMNSYYLHSDGTNHWYEVILQDRSHPAQGYLTAKRN